MTPPCSALGRVLSRFALPLWVSGYLSGCSAEPDPPASAATLHRQFPDQAAAVLDAREAFVGDGEGFHLGPAEVSGRPARPQVALPREGSEPIRFRTPSGAEVRVRELGAAGEGAPVGQAVAYRRSGGTSFWSATDHGVEEWLLLDEGVARGEVVAAWEVEGATLRERGEAVELVEAGRGAAMLRVSAPRAYASSGRPVAMALRARGSRIELSVDAGGEAVLVDPAWALTAGAMNVARSGHSATLLSSGKVLVAGGWDVGLEEWLIVTFDSAELYDPAADSWSFTGRMNHARSAHTATLLSSGKVLVAGGGYLAGSPSKAGSICAPSRCDGDLHSIEPARCTLASSACPAQVRVTCIAYRCDPERGACKMSCAGPDDCAPGFVCNLRGHCVRPPAAPGAAGGCSAASGSSSAAATRAFGLFVLGLAAARRWRRPAAAAPFAGRRNAALLRGE
ncbi:kelch repeat-containing protein [Sorangium sp. So ce134]